MYETIWIEKNKTSKFGVHFYEDASKWEFFKDICGISSKKQVLICSESIAKEEWNVFANQFEQEDCLTINENIYENDSALHDFIKKYDKNVIYVVLMDETVADYLYHNLNSDDIKNSFISIPVTSSMLFDALTIRPITDATGEIIRKEWLPQAVYMDVSLLNNATPAEFQNAIAVAFRLSISYKASLFEWMISNMYELTDGDEDALCEFLERGIQVMKERIEKDTAKDRAIPAYGNDFYLLLKNTVSDISIADLLSLSMVCQTYLSWKKEHITMEEFYEIRDMFVFFGLSITEDLATAEELMNTVRKSNSNLLKDDTCVYIRKVGKLLVEQAPCEELVAEALSQIYFDEAANE